LIIILIIIGPTYYYNNPINHIKKKEKDKQV